MVQKTPSSFSPCIGEWGESALCAFVDNGKEILARHGLGHALRVSWYYIVSWVGSSARREKQISRVHIPRASLINMLFIHQ